MDSFCSYDPYHQNCLSSTETTGIKSIEKNDHLESTQSLIPPAEVVVSVNTMTMPHILIITSICLILPIIFFLFRRNNNDDDDDEKEIQETSNIEQISHPHSIETDEIYTSIPTLNTIQNNIKSPETKPTGSSKSIVTTTTTLSSPIKEKDNRTMRKDHPIMDVFYEQNEFKKQSNRQKIIKHMNEYKEKMWNKSSEYIGWKFKCHLLSILLFLIVLLPVGMFFINNTNKTSDHLNVFDWSVVKNRKYIKCDTHSIEKDDVRNMNRLFNYNQEYQNNNNDHDGNERYKNTIDYWLSKHWCILEPLYRERILFYYEKITLIIHSTMIIINQFLISNIHQEKQESTSYVSNWFNGISKIKEMVSFFTLMIIIILFLFFVDTKQLLSIIYKLLIFILILDPIVHIGLEYINKTKGDDSVTSSSSNSIVITKLDNIILVYRNIFYFHKFSDNVEWKHGKCNQLYSYIYNNGRNTSSTATNPNYFESMSDMDFIYKNNPVYFWFLSITITLSSWNIGWIAVKCIYLIFPVITMVTLEYFYYWSRLIRKYFIISNIMSDDNLMSNDTTVMDQYTTDIQNTLDVNRFVLFGSDTILHKEDYKIVHRNWKVYMMIILYVFNWLLAPVFYYFIVWDNSNMSICSLPSGLFLIFNSCYILWFYLVVPLVSVILITNELYNIVSNHFIN